MKLKSLIFCLLIAGASFAQATIHFDKTNYNFGKIKKGIHKSVIFNFENSDKKKVVKHKKRKNFNVTSKWQFSCIL